MYLRLIYDDYVYVWNSFIYTCGGVHIHGNSSSGDCNHFASAPGVLHNSLWPTCDVHFRFFAQSHSVYVCMCLYVVHLRCRRGFCFWLPVCLPIMNYIYTNYRIKRSAYSQTYKSQRIRIIGVNWRVCSTFCRRATCTCSAARMYERTRAHNLC